MSHFAVMREEKAGHYAACDFCGWEGSRRSVRTDAVLDANRHRKKHHCVLWYVRPDVKHKRTPSRDPQEPQT